MTEELLAALKEYIGNDVDRLDDDIFDETYKTVIREYLKECPIPIPWSGEVMIMESAGVRAVQAIELTDAVQYALNEGGVDYDG